jgi:hypothetical protein
MGKDKLQKKTGRNKMKSKKVNSGKPKKAKSNDAKSAQKPRNKGFKRKRDANDKGKQFKRKRDANDKGKQPKKKFKKEFKKEEEKPDWNQIKAQKRQQRREKKETQPFAKASEALNQVWMVDWAKKKAPVRIAKVEEILKACVQDLKKILARKGAPRALLVLIKNGSVAQRSTILSALKGHLAKMSKDQKLHRLLPDLMKYGNKAQKKLICDEVLKNVSALASNRYACIVLDRILIDPTCKDAKLLALQQLYSKMFITLPEFDADGRPLTLEQIFEKDPEQKVSKLLCFSNAHNSFYL